MPQTDQMSAISTTESDQNPQRLSASGALQRVQVFIVYLLPLLGHVTAADHRISHTDLHNAAHNILHADQYDSQRSQVLRVGAASDADVKFIRQLQDRFDLDAWRAIQRANTQGDYLVPPHLSRTVRTFLRLNNIPYSVLVDDIKRFLREHADKESKHRAKRAVWPDQYRYLYLTFDEIIKFLDYVRSVATNATVRMGSLGRSFEGRETPYVKITSRRNPGRKEVIFIDGGFHSREWISPAMAIEVIYRLALNREEDPEVTQMLDRYDWIIVPVVNPDGYVYTFGSEVGARLWRKNRNTAYSGDPQCYGVDLNRNFGFMWNDSPGYGGSKDPCSYSYSGPFNFSEPESRNLRDLLLSNRGSIKSYLSFHSYGQFMLYPWGYADDVSIEDEEDLLHVANAFGETMQKRNYTYRIGGSAKSLYPAAGGSNDYARGTIGVKYAYTVELSPHEGSHYGFTLPETKVESVVKDTWEGLKALVRKVYNYSERRSVKLQKIADEMERRFPPKHGQRRHKEESIPVIAQTPLEESPSRDPLLQIFSTNIPTEESVIVLGGVDIPDLYENIPIEYESEEDDIDIPYYGTKKVVVGIEDLDYPNLYDDELQDSILSDNSIDSSAEAAYETENTNEAKNTEIDVRESEKLFFDNDGVLETGPTLISQPEKRSEAPVYDMDTTSNDPYVKQTETKESPTVRTRDQTTGLISEQTVVDKTVQQHHHDDVDLTEVNHSSYSRDDLTDQLDDDDIYEEEENDDNMTNDRRGYQSAVSDDEGGMHSGSSRLRSLGDSLREQYFIFFFYR